MLSYQALRNSHTPDSLLSKTPLDRRLIKLLKRRQEALDEQLHYPCILITTVAEDPLLQYYALCKTN